jgi:hypothetical protein
VRSLKNPFVVGLLAVVIGGMVLPADALAQRHRHRGRVFVGVGYPYYSPFYWNSFYGPWGPWGPYGYWPPPSGYYGAYGYASEVRIMATPREAEVYVDGYLVGTVDDFDGWSQRLRLQPGEHDIELYLEGHRGMKQRMLLRPGETYKIRASLERLAEGDQPAVRPTPSPEPSPSAAPERGATYHPRSLPRSRTRQAPDSGFGTLAIRVQPADAEVLVDGERWDRPEGDARLSIELSAGEHRVDVRRDGRAPYQSTVDVRPGEVTTLNISLPER